MPESAGSSDQARSAAPSPKPPSFQRVLLPRLHLFEIEDQAWCPTFLRDYGTDYLRLIQSWLGVPELVAPLLLEELSSTGATRIVDLCSGGSGPIVDLAALLARTGKPVTVLLTDKYPNRKAFERARQDVLDSLAAQQHVDASEAPLRYVSEPVDATAVPSHLRGLRTLFNALHHFRPAEATKVLADAVKDRQPIAVFEVSQRSVLSLLRILFVPIMVFVATPAIRPFRWGRLLWTYPLPAVPLLCLWDGMVSQLRAYSPKELTALAAASCDGSYRWQQGVLSGSTGEITYLLGSPAGEPATPE